MTTFMICRTRIRSLRQSWRDKRHHARSSEGRSRPGNKRKPKHNVCRIKKKKNSAAMKRCKSLKGRKSPRSPSYALITSVSHLLLLVSQSKLNSNLGRGLEISMITILATATIRLAACSNHRINSPVKGGKACIRDHRLICLLIPRSTTMIITMFLKPTSSAAQRTTVAMAATQWLHQLLHPFHTTRAFSTLWIYLPLLQLPSIHHPSSRCWITIKNRHAPHLCVTARSFLRSRISRHKAVAFFQLQRLENLAQNKLSIVLILMRQLNEQELIENGELSSIHNYEIFEIRVTILIYSNELTLNLFTVF